MGKQRKRKRKVLSIHRANFIQIRSQIAQEIAEKFGTEEYDKLMRNMHEATCDAPGIARHNCEAEFAKKLIELQNSKNI